MKQNILKALNLIGNIIGGIFLLTLIVGSMAGGALLAYVGGVLSSANPINPKDLLGMLEQTSYIVNQEGVAIERVESSIHREIVEYSKIPNNLVKAFLAIEDMRFMEHTGIDLKRIAGAALANYKTGSMQGASTINQQIAKNMYLTDEQSIERKLKDAYYGMLIDEALSKEEILEVYMNMVYLGSSTYGVQAASKTYFSKDVSELNLAESALLAGIIRNPNKYSPIKTLRKEDITENHMVLDDSDSEYSIVFNEETLKRQQLVLVVMRDNFIITEEQYKDAISYDIKENMKPERFIDKINVNYYHDMIYTDVVEALKFKGFTEEEAKNKLYYGGLKIYSAQDHSIQDILNKNYSKSSNFPGTVIEENIQPQSASVVIDNESGNIVAVIGGRETEGRFILNRALTPRQPGSSIKPLAAYIPALERGYNASTIVEDKVVYLDESRKNTPWPINWYGYYKGNISIREAVKQSSNVAPVTLVESFTDNKRTSLSIMIDSLEKLGITTAIRKENKVKVGNQLFDDETYSTIMGGMTYGVSPIEMAGAYRTLASNGIYNKPFTFTKIEDSSGEILFKSEDTKKIAIRSGVAYIMTDMLKDAVTSGTGTKAQINKNNEGIPVAGKTGTTTSKKDAWFVGYTPYYTMSTWIGFDKPSRLADGSGMASSLWSNIMKQIHKELKLDDMEFIVPNEIEEIWVNPYTGKLSRGEWGKKEIFLKGSRIGDYETEYSETEETSYEEETSFEEEETSYGEDYIKNLIESGTLEEINIEEYQNEFNINIQEIIKTN